MTAILDLCIADGDIEIRECGLPHITAAELRKWDISRRDLMRCFAEGVELMKGRTPSDRVRPIAAQRLDGVWEVMLCGYSALTDPLMQGDCGSAQ
jgi:hypothetical protein